MSANIRHVVLGYHGTNETSASVIMQRGFQPGQEDCWVGSAIYFWERDHALALKWCQQKGYDPPVIIEAEIENSPLMLDLVTKEGTDAYKSFVKHYQSDQRRMKQLAEWSQKNGQNFCDIYFIQMMFKTGSILGVRFSAMAHDDMLQDKPRTFVYVRKDKDKYKSRFVINVRIVLALKDSTLISSKHRCGNDTTKASRRGLKAD